MKYEVIRYFNDAQDNCYAYREGDTYPREGLTVSDSRIKDLLSGNNFQRVPLIKRVTSDEVAKSKAEPVIEAPKVEEPEEPQGEVVWTAEEIQKMPFMKLKSIAKKNGVDITDKKADEIRTELKEKLGI